MWQIANSGFVIFKKYSHSACDELVTIDANEHPKQIAPNNIGTISGTFPIKINILLPLPQPNC